MDYSPLILIGVSLAALFFGYFFGLFEGRGQGYQKRKNEEELEKAAKAPFENFVPPPSPPVASPENSLIRLSLDEQDQPQLALDGQHVETSALAPEQRKRLIDLMLMMRPWAEGRLAPAPTVPPKPATQPVTAAPVERTAASEQLTTPVAASAPNTAAVGPDSSIVVQIDAVLQARLIGTQLGQQGVRLVESTDGAVIVVVGQNRYSGVDEVPQPEVQAAIRAAIAEWEKRYTPG